MVLQDGARRFCLFVDEVIGQRQTATRGFSTSGGVEGLSGFTVLDDGRVSFLLDVDALLQWAAAASGASPSSTGTVTQRLDPSLLSLRRHHHANPDR